MDEAMAILERTPATLDALLRDLPEGWIYANEGAETWSPFGVVTLGQLLATWTAHDLDHLAQISRVPARQYSEAVGPWQAYLRIISGKQG